MLELIYPLSYFVSVVALILWFFFSEKRVLSQLMQKIFFGGLLVYFLSLFFSPGMLSLKFFALFRDLIVMAMLAHFFKFFKNNKLVFFIMLAVLIASFQFKGKSYLQSSLQATPISNNSNDGVFQKGELLVELKPGTSAESISALLTNYELDYKTAFHPLNGNRTDLDDYIVVDIPEKYENKRAEIIKELIDASSVDHVELNEIFEINPIPQRRSPSIDKRYGINDPDVSKQWGLDVMQMEKLYRLLKDKKISPAKTARVFIVDSGVEATHEDLKARYQSVNTEYDQDKNGHGTHCAGIAAAITNNGKGIASVFPEDHFAKVSGVKVVNFLGLITQQRLIEGIIEAIDQGADVVSVSIGSKSREAAQEAFQEVVEYADKANAIIVVAAGNSNENATDYTPANASGVITVAAIDQKVDKAFFSNTVDGLEMGLAAPGVDIYSTFPNNKYKIYSGTSMACPQVAGLIGLMKSIRPELTTKQAYDILKQTGKKTSATKLTGPLIQPAEAIQQLLLYQ